MSSQLDNKINWQKPFTPEDFREWKYPSYGEPISTTEAAEIAAYWANKRFGEIIPFYPMSVAEQIRICGRCAGEIVQKSKGAK